MDFFVESIDHLLFNSLHKIFDSFDVMYSTHFLSFHNIIFRI